MHDPDPGNSLEEQPPLLTVRGLTKHFPIKGGVFNRVVGQVKAVDGVDLEVFPGECLGLVGESGSGKSTVGKCIVRTITPTNGTILLQREGHSVDLARLPRHQLKLYRSDVQMVFQDPFASLNPRMTVLDIIGEPLLCHGRRSRSQREQRVRELLRQVGLNANHLHRYPHAFSGGQRQRIGIARALALNPKLIIADEPVSALDVSVQAQVLNLLTDLQRDLGLSFVFIAHDLAVVRHISNRIAVMYLGKVVELAEVDTLFAAPKHPYTEALLAAIPQVQQHGAADKSPRGEVADPSNPPTGCAYHPRCPYAEPRCKAETPALRRVDEGQFVRCHRATELTLAGAAIPDTAATVPEETRGN